MFLNTNKTMNEELLQDLQVKEVYTHTNSLKTLWERTIKTREDSSILLHPLLSTSNPLTLLLWSNYKKWIGSWSLFSLDRIGIVRKVTTFYRTPAGGSGSYHVNSLKQSQFFDALNFLVTTDYLHVVSKGLRDNHPTPIKQHHYLFGKRGEDHQSFNVVVTDYTKNWLRTVNTFKKKGE